MIAACAHTTFLNTISGILPWLLVIALAIIGLTAFGFTRRIRNRAKTLGTDLQHNGLSWSQLLLGGSHHSPVQ